MCVLSLSDVTSCALRNGGCDHFCSLGSDGHVQCSCKAGWELSSDQRSCVGKAHFNRTAHMQLCVTDLNVSELCVFSLQMWMSV